ncbi:hypothetical protein C479_13383 [Halovivax asiaticus JCM 14624]|uniref:Uncharacterized protein n=1 Tax=Halovivax asiaticus JCM 14624 TaxID=1227490 RepID=M0BF93_9EURY|nr:hypothetical protein C479_13383 [Halovivax asiaticus JCM 14624]
MVRQDNINRFYGLLDENLNGFPKCTTVELYCSDFSGTTEFLSSGFSREVEYFHHFFCSNWSMFLYELGEWLENRLWFHGVTEECG